jgi:hypothetical protein
MSPMSAEATVVRNYVDWILSLPWNHYKDDKTDLDAAEGILNEDHYGLEKPKQRILEYLAVQSLVDRMRGPILCFVGPPGVGKTSLGRSIARATSRDFVRISLGFRASRRRVRATPSSCSTKSTRCRWISVGIRRPRCSRCSIPSRITRSTTTISTWTTTCRG